MDIKEKTSNVICSKSVEVYVRLYVCVCFYEIARVCVRADVFVYDRFIQDKQTSTFPSLTASKACKQFF